MAPVYLIRVGYSLLPSDEAAETELERYRDGETIMATLRRERNMAQHRLFWAICDHVSKALAAMGKDTDRETIAAQLKVATGHAMPLRLGYKARQDTGHTWAMVPKSIDFASMDGAAFGEFLNRAIGFIVTDLLPHLPTSETRDKLLGLLDADQRRAYMMDRSGHA